MRKKLCLVMYALTLSMLIACGENETTTTQPESVTEAVDVTINEETVEIPSEEVMEEISEVIVAEPAIAYTDDIAFAASYDTIYVEGLEGVDVKTLEGYEVTASDSVLLETGEPAYYYYVDTNGIAYRFSLGWYQEYTNSENCTVESVDSTDEFGNEVLCQTVTIDTGDGFQENYRIEKQTLINADGKEVIYEYFTYEMSGYWYGSQFFYVPLGIKRGDDEAYLIIKIDAGDNEETHSPIKVNAKDYIELTRECYYNIKIN